MVENKNFEGNSEVRTERFEFVLTVNGNIICQRYFRIGGFKERSLGSSQLIDAMHQCVSIINNDLKEKSNIYNWEMAPQVFQNRAEMDKWLAHYGQTKRAKLEVPSFVVFRDSDEMFVWNGNEMQPYAGYFDKSDFDGSMPENPCVLKLTFLENKNEVRSISWSISDICPRFVRTNIDLSNSKNKYEVDGVTKAPIESFLVKKFMKSMTSIIPKILNTISTACSYDSASDYTTYVDYGGRKYDINVKDAEAKYIKKVESQYRSKTNEYFRS